MNIQTDRSKSALRSTIDDRNLTEQLRYNHIETLEVLDRLQTENENLQRLVNNFKKQIVDMGGSVEGEVQFQPEERCANVTIDFAKLTDKQAKEIAQLKEKLKSTIADERKKFNEMQSKLQQELSQHIMRLSQREKDLLIQVKSLEETAELNKNSNQQLLLLHNRIMDLNELVHLKDNEMVTLKLANEIAKNEILDLQDIIASKDLELQAAKCELQRNSCQLENFRVLMDDEKNRNSELKQCQDVVAKLQQDLRLSHTQNLDLLHQYDILKAENALLMAAERPSSDCIPKVDNYSPGIRQIVITAKSETSTGSSLPEQIDAELKTESIIDSKSAGILPCKCSIVTSTCSSIFADDDSSSTFRFNDYIRLKRENKELKMQLADILGKQQIGRKALDSSPNISTSSRRGNTVEKSVKFPKVPKGNCV